MFKLNLFDFEKDEIIKTLEKKFCPTYIYIEFERIREEVEKAGKMTDIELIDRLCGTFLKFFPELTKEEYYENTVLGDVLYIYAQIVSKAATLKSFSSKN